MLTVSFFELAVLIKDNLYDITGKKPVQTLLKCNSECIPCDKATGPARKI
jgi:hypothetical protein